MLGLNLDSPLIGQRVRGLRELKKLSGSGSRLKKRQLQPYCAAGAGDAAFLGAAFLA
jgi:hypothetical protein